jgi:uncharacterized membrane protein
MLVYFAGSTLLLGAGILRSSREMVHAFDTGIYLQILSSLRGAWLASGLPGILHLQSWASSVTGENTFLAHHFQPIVALLLPLYSVFPSTSVLFFASWIALGITAVMLGMHSAAICQNMNPGTQPAGVIADATGPLFMCLFPAFSARLYFGFAPDVLAVPAFALQAILLNSIASRGAGALILFALAQVWAGACKEVFWIINGWAAMILAIRLNRVGRRQAAVATLVWGLAQWALFFWLFLRWMPDHSQHSQYYGLNYIDFKLTALLQSNWGAVMELLLAAGFLAVLLRPTWAFFMALPGLAIIVLARYNQIQSPTAIYPLAFAPFFAVILAENMAILSGWRRRLSRLLVFAALAAGVILQFPLFARSVGPAFSKSAEALPVDLAVARKMIGPGAWLLVDGNLQPAFRDWQHVRVILGFIGNPAPLGPEDFKRATDVLTMFDLDQLASCAEVKPDVTDDWAARGVPFHDYDGFQRFCEWLRAVPRQKQVYPESGLVHYHLN